MKTLAIYGGTFDPVHNGHIQTALTIQNHFKFDQFYFVPCKDPLIKPACSATALQRVAMLELAIQDHPNLQIDQREIARDTPSYMVETLQSFRMQHPQTAITLILGWDAFQSLPLWHQWQKLITLTNMLVIDRIGTTELPLDQCLVELLKRHRTHDTTALLHNLYGQIITFNAGNFDVASRIIKQKLQKHENIKGQIPSSVYHYIQSNHLYQT